MGSKRQRTPMHCPISKTDAFGVGKLKPDQEAQVLAAIEKKIAGD